MTTLTVNDLHFVVRRSEQRQALEISVNRDGMLTLAAPAGVPVAKLRDFAHRKRMWIYRQLARKQLLSPQAPPKAFTDGEVFAYLGRNYRLRLVRESDVPVKLTGGRFLMPKALVPDGREHLIRWYRERAQVWLAERVGEFAARMEVMPTGVRVQDLGFRWGSCGRGDVLYFHWKTILLPARIAEYVVVHEMAHLIEPHHTPEFWRRVERALPDLEQRKNWLAHRGEMVEGL